MNVYWSSVRGHACTSTYSWNHLKKGWRRGRLWKQPSFHHKNLELEQTEHLGGCAWTSVKPYIFLQIWQALTVKHIKTFDMKSWQFHTWVTRACKETIQTPRPLAMAESLKPSEVSPFQLGGPSCGSLQTAKKFPWHDGTTWRNYIELLLSFVSFVEIGEYGSDAMSSLGYRGKPLCATWQTMKHCCRSAWTL